MQISHTQWRSEVPVRPVLEAWFQGQIDWVSVRRVVPLEQFVREVKGRGTPKRSR